MCRLTRPRSASEKHCTKGPAATSRPRANVAPTTESLTRPCHDATTQQGRVYTQSSELAPAPPRASHNPLRTPAKTPSASAVQRIVNAPTAHRHHEQSSTVLSDLPLEARVHTLTRLAS